MSAAAPAWEKNIQNERACLQSKQPERVLENPEGGGALIRSRAESLGFHAGGSLRRSRGSCDLPESDRV